MHACLSQPYQTCCCTTARCMSMQTTDCGSNALGLPARAWYIPTAARLDANVQRPSHHNSAQRGALAQPRVVPALARLRIQLERADGHLRAASPPGSTRPALRAGHAAQYAQCYLGCNVPR